MVGIWTYGSNNTISGNRLVKAFGSTESIGIEGSQYSKTICSGNTVSGFMTPMNYCLDGGGNVSN